jgi:hypothetical protein
MRNPTSTCWRSPTAAEKPFAESWNGTTWSATSAPPLPSGMTNGALEGLSCTSATSCMAGGNAENGSLGRHQALAESWNGTKWTQINTPNPSEAPGGNDFYAVSCLSANSCFAVGRRVNKYEEPFSGWYVPLEGRGLAETWNGTTWSVQATANPESMKWVAFAGISCSSSTACTAVGTSYPGETGSGAESFTLGEAYE